MAPAAAAGHVWHMCQQYSRTCLLYTSFYDKFLAAHPSHPTIALCYGFQMLDHLDVDAHDIPVDAVLSADVEAEG